MANFVFDISLGRVVEVAEQLPAAFDLMLLKAADPKATLQPAATVAAMLANAGTTEADFTNYARVQLQNVTVDIDPATHIAKITADDVTFTDAGGTLDNTLVAGVIYQKVTDDNDSPPLTYGDLTYTTTGVTWTFKIPTTGFYDAVDASA